MVTLNFLVNPLVGSSVSNLAYYYCYSVFNLLSTSYLYFINCISLLSIKILLPYLLQSLQLLGVCNAYEQPTNRLTVIHAQKKLTT